MITINSMCTVNSGHCTAYSSQVNEMCITNEMCSFSMTYGLWLIESFNPFKIDINLKFNPKINTNALKYKLLIIYWCKWFIHDWKFAESII